MKWITSKWAAMAMVLVALLSVGAAFDLLPSRQELGVIAGMGLALCAGTFALQHNIGAWIAGAREFANTAVTAGGAGDNAVITGGIIDRAAYNMPLSAVIIIDYTTTLAAAATMTFKNVVVQHGDTANLADAVTYATLEDANGSVIETGAAGGSTNTGAKNYDVDLGGAKRYIRILLTPDLSAGATDTAALAGVIVLGGSDTLPA